MRNQGMCLAPHSKGPAQCLDNMSFNCFFNLAANIESHCSKPQFYQLKLLVKIRQKSITSVIFGLRPIQPIEQLVAEPGNFFSQEWRSGFQMWYLLSCSSSENSHEESQGARTRGNSCSQGAQKAGQESQWGVAEGQQLPSLSIHYFLLFSLSFLFSKSGENPAGMRWARGIGQSRLGISASA